MPHQPLQVLAASIVEDLQAVLEQFAAIAEELGNGSATSEERVVH